MWEIYHLYMLTVPFDMTMDYMVWPVICALSITRHFKYLKLILKNGDRLCKS